MHDNKRFKIIHYAKLKLKSIYSLNISISQHHIININNDNMFKESIDLYRVHTMSYVIYYYTELIQNILQNFPKS